MPLALTETETKASAKLKNSESDAIRMGQALFFRARREPAFLRLDEKAEPEEFFFGS